MDENNDQEDYPAEFTPDPAPPSEAHRQERS